MDTPTTHTETETAAAQETSPATAEKGKKATKPKKNATEALEKQLDEAQTALAAQQDQYQRILAEYANYKRRTEQEKEQLGGFVRGETLGKLLPVLDDLERAADAPVGDGYQKGVQMTLQNFKKVLTELGLEPIEAQGAAFDPEWHNAVMREDADGVEPDTVTAVLQKGYRYGGRVLRPAMVKVAN